jgi:hypothetical protein
LSESLEIKGNSNVSYFATISLNFRFSKTSKFIICKMTTHFPYLSCLVNFFKACTTAPLPPHFSQPKASLACQGPPLVAPEWQGQLQKGLILPNFGIITYVRDLRKGQIRGAFSFNA